MRSPRSVIAIALLAIYVAQVVGGRPLHLWQSATGQGSCCSSTGCHDGLSGEELSDAHASAHHHDLDGHHHGQPGGCDPAGDESGDRHQHDSSNCWVCKVLGQAQDKPHVSPAVFSFAASPEAVVTRPFFFATLSHAGFRSRAPPIA